MKLTGRIVSIDDKNVSIELDDSDIEIFLKKSDWPEIKWEEASRTQKVHLECELFLEDVLPPSEERLKALRKKLTKWEKNLY